MVVKSVELAQRECAGAGFDGSQSKAEARERHSDRQPDAKRTGQADWSDQFQANQHERRMTEEQIAEETPRFSLNQSHAGRVDGRGQ